jgi:CRP-like cAMP-binding protein
LVGIADLKEFEGEGVSSGVTTPAPEALLDALRAMASTVVYKNGQDIFRQGDRADALYAVESGLLEVSSLSEQGQKLTHLVLRPGTVFGEIAVFDGGVRTATVTAMRDSVVLRVPGATLINGLGRDADLAVGLIRLVIDRMRWMHGEIDDLVFRPLEVRVARRLEFLVRTIGRNGSVEISQGNLAEHVGATREAVSKVVNELKRLGIVELWRGRIVVRDQAALRRKGAYGQG